MILMPMEDGTSADGDWQSRETGYCRGTLWIAFLRPSRDSEALRRRIRGGNVAENLRYNHFLGGAAKTDPHINSAQYAERS